MYIYAPNDNTESGSARRTKTTRAAASATLVVSRAREKLSRVHRVHRYIHTATHAHTNRHTAIRTMHRGGVTESARARASEREDFERLARTLVRAPRVRVYYIDLLRLAAMESVRARARQQARRSPRSRCLSRTPAYYTLVSRTICV